MYSEETNFGLAFGSLSDHAVGSDRLCVALCITALHHWPLLLLSCLASSVTGATSS